MCGMVGKQRSGLRYWKGDEGGGGWNRSRLCLERRNNNTNKKKKRISETCLAWFLQREDLEVTNSLLPMVYKGSGGTDRSVHSFFSRIKHCPQRKSEGDGPGSSVPSWGKYRFRNAGLQGDPINEWNFRRAGDDTGSIERARTPDLVKLRAARSLTIPTVSGTSI